MIYPTCEHHELPSSSCPIHYVTQGARGAPLIVFVHPAFSDHTCFAGQLDAFATDHRVLALDMIGHGRSQPADARASLSEMGNRIAEIVVREGYQEAHLVGISLGSLIIQDVAYRLPELVQTLTVVGGYRIAGSNPELQRVQQWELLRRLPLMVFALDRFRRQLAADTVVQPAARELFYQSARSFTRRSFRAMSGLDAIMRSTPQTHTHPLQIIVGAHERPLLQRETRAWHYAEPLSEYIVIADAGHCANMDQPVVFNEHVRAFIARARHVDTAFSATAGAA